MVSLCPPRTATLTSFARSLHSLSELSGPCDDAEWQALFAGQAGMGRGVTVRGAGAGYGDAALNSAGVVALTGAQHRVGLVDAVAGVMDVDAGASLGAVLARAVPVGWTLPVVPGTARASVGGAVAADVHGKNHPGRSSIGAHVAALVLLTPTDGPRTLTRGTDPGAFWATVGGLGLTGVIRRVRLRLERVHSAWLRSTDRVGAGLAEVLELMEASGDQHAVAWLDGHAAGRAIGRGVVTTGSPLATEDLPARLVGRAREYPSPGRPGWPGRPWWPGTAPGATAWLPNLLTPDALRAANAARYARARARGGRPEVRHLRDFFFPLDALPGWAALYGRPGFIQYQLAVPPGQEAVLAEALQALQATGCPPALVSLKRLGAPPPGAAAWGSLSFPVPGWTLAMDLPVPGGGGAGALAATLDHLDERVATAGGRVYLVKDARLRPDVLAAMYPGLARWREERRRLDPGGVMTSDLDRRLGLSAPRRGASA
ncbi:FAD-binding protein [Georgenia sp. SYP-B2076]|uniref:FAD-binding protein n=1 Tax=Georgenia sp. SYP-B2076 TaxID=2495881 RepID=UPI000F8D16B3|nr:FAD-binding protein [Georgenia sp. SYP-B2076]